MADRYVYSGATGSGTGANWANAHTTLAAACSAASSGDRVFVADDHAETQNSAMTINIFGFSTSPTQILCVRRVGGSVPPVPADLRKTATITTTGNYSITIGDYLRYGRMYGLNFYCGTGPVTANLTINAQLILDCCTLNLGTTTGLSRIIFGGGSGQVFNLVGSTAFGFGNVGQQVQFQSHPYIWTGDGSPGVVGSNIPTLLIANWGIQDARITGVDFSNMGSGKTLIGQGVNSGQTVLVNCKLDSAVTITPNPSQPFHRVDVIGCNSSGNVQRNERYMRGGTLTTETTVVRTGGASDGTTAYSWKIVAPVENRVDTPFRTFDSEIWNDTTGSAKTLTVHVLTNNVTLTDEDIWLEVEYLGSSGTPIVARTNDAMAILGTPSNQASDSGQAWTTTGVTTPLKQKLECTFTPQLKGTIRWRVCYSKASSTVYVCPKPDLT